MKSYIYIVLFIIPLALLACENDPWKNPRERFEAFSNHLSKREIKDAMVFVDPEDRKVFETNFEEIPKEFRDETSVFFVGAVNSPRLIRRIELELPKDRPVSGTPLKLTLHYMNEDKKTAYLVWRDQWYVDLIR